MTARDLLGRVESCIVESDVGRTLVGIFIMSRLYVCMLVCLPMAITVQERVFLCCCALLLVGCYATLWYDCNAWKEKLLLEAVEAGELETLKDLIDKGVSDGAAAVTVSTKYIRSTYALQ
jgi:hypothetical protein